MTTTGRSAAGRGADGDEVVLAGGARPQLVSGRALSWTRASREEISPPAQIGECHLVGDAPSGAWAQQAGKIAAMTAGGWRFIDPLDGLDVYDRSSGYNVTFRAGTWNDGVVQAPELRCGGEKVVGARQPAIPNPTGRTVVDTEARVAIGNILAAMRTHGLISG